MVSACLEDLEMSGNLIAVTKMSGNLVKVSKLSGKNLVMDNVSCAYSRILPFTIFHFYVAVDDSVFKLCIHSFAQQLLCDHCITL